MSPWTESCVELWRPGESLLGNFTWGRLLGLTGFISGNGGWRYVDTSYKILEEVFPCSFRFYFISQVAEVALLSRSKSSQRLILRSSLFLFLFPPLGAQWALLKRLSAAWHRCALDVLTGNSTGSESYPTTQRSVLVTKWYSDLWF